MKQENWKTFGCCSEYLESCLSRSHLSGRSVASKDKGIYTLNMTRRDFLRVGGVSIAGYSLLPMLMPQNVAAKEKVEPRGGAEICILLFLQGGPSQLDTFDLKEGSWTPEDFDIRTISQGLRMPAGLLPQLSERTDKYALIRSLKAWEPGHDLGTYHLQAGRAANPATAPETPSIGSVIAYETMGETKESDFLPPYIAFDMHSHMLVGSGILPSKYEPMSLVSDATPSFALPEAERAGFEIKRALLEELEAEWRDAGTGRGRIFSDLDEYDQSAYRLSNPKAAPVFNVGENDHQRYGASGVGDACAMARNLVEADAGTKFILISHAGWDLHAEANTKTIDKYGHYYICAQLDAALAGLLDDLEARTDEKGRRLIDKTFIVCMGEFGRTPGDLNDKKGRDHYPNVNVGLFAGAGVMGGNVLGETDETAAKVINSGWHKERSMYPEDVLATMYSVMGIDWTKKITQTPSGRAFEYIENVTPKGLMDFEEIRELFA